jgi:hypothetical protein
VAKLNITYETARTSLKKIFKKTKTCPQAELVLASGNANETDMILRNSNTGALEIYDITNNALVGAYSAGAVGLNWAVGGIASDALSVSSGSDVDQLVQAMAGFGGGSGAADGLNVAPFSADTSQQTFLTTPQHA